jgi:glycosyltransferase involved in cell wall biosynthesis
MYWLGKALLQLGHRVTLIAHPDSHIPGAELRPLPDPECDDDSWTRLIPDSTDVLHLRRAPRGPLPKPYVFTVGGNGQPGQKFPRNTLFVSESHARNHCSTHFVHNGIDPTEYECAAEREDYAVFLAKASWDVKNLPGAIEVCRRAGVDLHVIGSRNWPLNLHRYLPRFRGVHYHGMLGQKDKIAVLRKARCLVFPVRWHEPCANAINEALASGCYIAATPYGCLPEIVAARVGYLSNRADDLAAVVADPGRFSPTTNRAHILEHFTHLHMAQKYLEYYLRVITTGTLDSAVNGQPQTAPGFSANQLLDWFS